MYMHRTTTLKLQVRHWWMNPATRVDSPTKPDPVGAIYDVLIE